MIMSFNFRLPQTNSIYPTITTEVTPPGPEKLSNKFTTIELPAKSPSDQGPTSLTFPQTDFFRSSLFKGMLCINPQTLNSQPLVPDPDDCLLKTYAKLISIKMQSHRFPTSADIRSQYHYTCAVQPGVTALPKTEGISHQIEMLKKDLASDQNIQNFDPYDIDLEHPIHKTLQPICKEFLDLCQNLKLTDKIATCEQIVNEIVYRTMANKEQMLEWTTVKEESNQPKFELLEIAVRYHLFLAMAAQEQTQILNNVEQKRPFPLDLKEREQALLKFMTKNSCYSPQKIDATHYLLNYVFLDTLADEKTQTAQTIAGESLDGSIKIFETYVKSTLKDLGLQSSSHASNYFNSALRKSLSTRLIWNQANDFKSQFNKDGSISSKDVLEASVKISTFISEGGKLLNGFESPKIELFARIFDLQAVDDPFDQVRSKIQVERVKCLDEAEKNKDSSKKGMFSWSKPNIEAQRKAINTHMDKKLQTINWVKNEWADLVPAPTFAPPPSAPSDMQEQLVPPGNEDNCVTFESSDESLNSLPPPEDDNRELGSDDTSEPKFFPKKDVPATTEKQSTPPPPVTAKVVPAATDLPLTLPQQQQIQQIPVVRAIDKNIPKVSYVDIVFPDLLKNKSDDQAWKALPEIVQQDVLLHVFHNVSFQGKIEGLAARLFQDVFKLEGQLEILRRKKLTVETKGLSEEFVRVGKDLLEFYYSPRSLKQPLLFHEEFKKLPQEELFLQYFGEMAIAANLEIPAWDKDFAANHWADADMRSLSIQALERCLHTTVGQKSASESTEIRIKCQVPSGHHLTIRGEGGDLKWGEGKPLEKIGEDTYVYRITGSKGNIEYKILFDDLGWESCPNHTVEAGKSTEITPDLKIPKTPLITVSYNGNGQLFIRGTGPGMNWVKGVAMKKVGVGMFAFEGPNDANDFEFKFLIDDDINRWSQGEDFKFSKGKTTHFVPRF
jgi:hypothetical protein